MSRSTVRETDSWLRGGMRHLAIVLCIAALYVATGRLGLRLAHVQENATLIWAPTGLSLAALVLFGRRVWPGVLIGAAVTNATIGTSPLALIGIAAGNTLEAVVGATLLEKVALFDPAFARLRDVLGFLVYGALLSTLIAATVGVGSLYLTGAVDARSFGAVWLIWWLGDAGGAAVVAPLLLVGLEGRPSWTAMARRPETWVALALLATLTSLGFGGTVAGPQSLLPALLVFPVLVWVGLRLGPRGAIVGSFLAGVAAVLGTARELGPFAEADPSTSSFLVWAYVSTMGAVAMILAAAVAEREDADLARQRGEEERARLSAQVQHTQRLESLGSLAGGVAHDFNNLLTTIRGNAELLRLGARLDAPKREALLDDIDMASVQAANLCRQLLTYAGHNRPEKQRLCLIAAIEETAPLLRSSIARTVDLRIGGGKPQFIEGDRTQIGQILMNLVINAAESIGDARGWVRVSVSTQDVDQRYLEETFLHSNAPAGSYVVLEVADSGSGMTPAMMERIFDPFFTTKKTGRGLGMATVRGIVSAHQGAIKVRSRPGEGTIFEVLFPVAPDRAAAPELVAAPTEQGEPIVPEPGSGKTVLLTDDEDRVRTVMRRVLEGAGFEVLEARDGVEAVEIFETKLDEIDLVLLDVSMPRLSGTDALAKIHELRPEVPAVLMSGYDEGRVDPSSGAVFLQKPFRMAVLLDTVARLLRARSARLDAVQARNRGLEPG